MLSGGEHRTLFSFLEEVLHSLDGTELAAHGTDILFSRLSGLVEPSRLFRIQGELDLSLPVEVLTGLRHFEIPLQGLPVSPGDVCRMARDPCCNHSFSH